MNNVMQQYGFILMHRNYSFLFSKWITRGQEVDSLRGSVMYVVVPFKAFFIDLTKTKQKRLRLNNVSTILCSFG